MLTLHRKLSSKGTMTSIKLYKYLFRECEKLPKEAQQFYKHTIRQSYKQHVTEADPIRIKEIIAKAYDDSKWVLKKYSENLKSGGKKPE